MVLKIVLELIHGFRIKIELQTFEEKQQLFMKEKRDLCFCVLKSNFCNSSKLGKDLYAAI